MSLDPPPSREVEPLSRSWLKWFSSVRDNFANFALLEEGAWTPALTFATSGNLNVVYATQAGRYTKTGRLVTVSYAIITSTFTHTTASGGLRITGLPFTAANTPDRGGGCINLFEGVTKANYTQFAFTPFPATTYAIAYASGSGQVSDNINAADMPTGTNKSFYGEFTYQT